MPHLFSYCITGLLLHTELHCPGNPTPKKSFGSKGQRSKTPHKNGAFPLSPLNPYSLSNFSH